MNIRYLKAEWEGVTLEKIFEIPVIDLRSGEEDWVVFDIGLHVNSYKKNDGKLYAQHVALNQQQAESKYVAYCEIDIDLDFSLDMHLQALNEVCTSAIIESEFYKLREE
jgi:hypothetical protein